MTVVRVGDSLAMTLCDGGSTCRGSLAMTLCDGSMCKGLSMTLCDESTCRGQSSYDVV